MVRVIVINGAGASGKDTFVDLFSEVSDYPVANFSSVDEVKHFATLLGWDGVKDDKGRRLLCDIKEALIRYSDAPYQYMKKKVEEFTATHKDGFIFFHVREPEEIQKMVDRLNAYTVLVERPSINKESFGNHADKNVAEFDYDYNVYNGGSVFDLKACAMVLYHQLTQ